MSTATESGTGTVPREITTRVSRRLYLPTVGFILARTVGIFGFHLTFSSGLAYTVLVVEAVAVILLGITALLMPGSARSAA